MASQVQGPGGTTGFAWIVLAACFLLNMFTFGLYRCSSILYVHMIEVWGVSREEASWPFSAYVTTMLLANIVPGLLTQYISIRSLSIVGSFLVALGIGGCYFARNVSYFVVFYGVIQGLGVSVFAVVLPIICNLYFDRRRGLASSIAFSGPNFAVFIFAPLIEYLLREYGLRGAMLILGGIVLNCVAASSLLRRPPEIKSSKTFPDKQDKTEITQSPVFLNETDLKSSVRNTLPLMSKKEVPNTRVSTLRPSLPSADSILYVEIRKDMSALLSGQNNKTSNGTSQVPLSQSDFQAGKEHQFSPQCVDGDEKNHNGTPGTSLNSASEFDCCDEHASSKCFKSSSKRFCFKSNNWLNVAVRCLSASEIFLKPMFYIICITHVLYLWVYSTVLMFVADFLLDRGLSKDSSVIVISMLPVSDLIAKISSGCLADRKIIRRKHVALIGLLLTGLSTLTVPIIKDPYILVTAYQILSFGIGCLIPLVNVLLVEYLGLDKLGQAFSFSNFFCGLVALTKPPLVGYFRDSIGSYDGLFYLQGTISILVALLWLFEPLFVKY